jgi:hypothetical protein
MLTDLPDDIQEVLLSKLDDVSLIMLCHTNKYYHNLVSCYGKINWNSETEKLAKQKWPEIFIINH